VVSGPDRWLERTAGKQRLAVRFGLPPLPTAERKHQAAREIPRCVYPLSWSK
jgi:hypothetical protein